MMKDKFKNEAEEIKIPNKNFKNKIDNIIEKRLESKEEIQVVGLNLFDMEEKEEERVTADTVII